MVDDPHKGRDVMLADVAREYGVQLTQDLVNLIRKDGFDKSTVDTVTLSSMTIAHMITHVLVATSVVNERCAFAARDLLIEHLENSKEWL